MFFLFVFDFIRENDTRQDERYQIGKQYREISNQIPVYRPQEYTEDKHRIHD